MNKGTLWTIVGVAVAVLVAWAIVSVVFSVLWFAVRLGVVLIVAIAVFFLLRSFFTRRRD